MLIHSSDPATITGGIESVTASQADNVAFKCCFKGHPQPTVEWYFKDNVIQDEGKFIIETSAKISILDIAEVSTEDGGDYKCVVTNSFGNDESVATLSIKTIGMLFLSLLLTICPTLHLNCFCKL